MRTGISITLTSSDRLRLEAVISNRNTPQKHVWRAAIVLQSADGVGTTEIMRRTGTSKTCVWRWQERFMQEGVDGLLHDKTCPSRIKPLGSEVAERVITLTLTGPRGRGAPLDRLHDGPVQWHQRQCGAPDVAGSWSPAPALSPVGPSHQLNRLRARYFHSKVERILAERIQGTLR